MVKKSYLPQLDGLRGLCALAIVWAHFPLVDASWGDFRYLAIFFRLDYLGVDVFFVLSGFLITRILLNDKQNKISLKYFYIRRSLRIFPIYYILIGAVWLFFNEKHLIWNFLYLTNLDAIITSGPRIQNPFPHCWSLAVEEHFYIIWPILVYCVSDKTAKIYCCYIIPLFVLIYSGLICLIYDGEMARKAIYFSTVSRMLSLGFGAIIAYYEDYFEKTNTTIIGWGCLGVGYFFLNYYYFIWAPFTGEIQPLLDQIGGTLFSFGVVLIVLHYAKINKLKILSTKPMKFLGSISYGMYLYHYVLIYYLGYSERRTQNPIQVNEAIVLLVLIIIVPVLSFIIIEKPLLRLKDRFSSTATT